MADIERGAATNGGHGDHLHGDMDNETALKKIRTAGSVSISPETFEALFLSPQNRIKGDLRKTFGNPTPIALIGFLLSLTPLTCDLMGWRGAGGNGTAGNASYFGFGAILMIIGGFFELILGNTFPAVVFTSFGAFWFTYGGTLVPAFAATSGYAATGGANSPSYASSFAFFLLWMGFMCLLYLVCALRTNMIFVGIFFTLVMAFGFLAGAFWNIAEGQMDLAMKLQTGGGACAFITCLLGWYLFFIQILASVDFPFSLPVGDLSTKIKGKSDKKA